VAWTPPVGLVRSPPDVLTVAPGPRNILPRGTRHASETGQRERARARTLTEAWIERLEAYLGRQDHVLPLLADAGDAILGLEGSVASELRRAAFRGEPVAADIDPYLDKVRRHAYRVTDEDVAGLHEAGWSDDEIFELTVAAASGQAFYRLHRGLRAVGDID
jgi:hypothetical protein